MMQGAVPFGVAKGAGEACAVCGARVVVRELGQPDLRRGPEGRMRCYEHLGVPLPAEQDDVPEPEPNRDYFEERRMVWSFDIVVRVRVAGWLDPDVDDEAEDKAQDAAFAHMRAGQYDDAEVLNVEAYPARERRFVDAAGKPFDEPAWYRKKGFMPKPAPRDAPRAGERPLEVVA